MTGSAVTVRDLLAGYVEDKPVLDLPALEVGGGLCRIGGRNGSGKSTLIEVLSGYLRPLAGEVSVLGSPADSDGQLRARRRTVRTRPALFPYMTVRDHLAVAARSQGVPLEDSLARVEELGLAEWLDRNAQTLSSGTAKKVWFVMCTVGSADLYLLDEPFNAVDDDGIAAMVHDINGWAQRSAVILVCHQLPPGIAPDAEVWL